MNSETVKRLVQLNDDIASIERILSYIKDSGTAVTALRCTRRGNYDAIETAKIPLLNEELKSVATEWIEGHLEELHKIYDNLILCTKDESKKVTYKPTEIDF